MGKLIMLDKKELDSISTLNDTIKWGEEMVVLKI